MQQSTGEPSWNLTICHQIPISNPTEAQGKRHAKLGEIIKSLPTKGNWILSSKRLPPENLLDIFEAFQEDSKIPGIQCLYLHWNELPELILVPMKYTFPDLKILNIGGNNIQSLQRLHKANFDKLEELWLWFNRLVRIDSIRKCHFPVLKRLDIGDNRILQCPKLYEMHCPLLKLLNVEKNGLTNLQNFAKMLNNTTPTSQLLLQFTCNKMVKAFSQPCKKGKKMINQLTYTRKDGIFNLKFH